MEATAAILFTAYMVPVSLIDNIMRPLVMGRGLATPMPVVFAGLIGGVVTYGLIGIFIGPIVLAVAWGLLVAWISDAEPSEAAGASRRGADNGSM
jgi:predicted PurR-regulated permease PerM